ncbi:hypothetical protein D918_00968 [Trichuris suis]|nr:hypothetical protein D918_00968 [Trichuris suis]
MQARTAVVKIQCAVDYAGKLASHLPETASPCMQFEEIIIEILRQIIAHPFKGVDGISLQFAANTNIGLVQQDKRLCSYNHWCVRGCVLVRDEVHVDRAVEQE